MRLKRPPKKSKRHQPRNLRGHLVAKAFIIRRAGRAWKALDTPLAQSLPLLMPGEGWYVARVGQGADTKVEETLSATGMAVFVAKYKRTESRDEGGRPGSKRVTRELHPLLIPGYVFVGFDGGADGDALVRGTVGVTTLLSFWDANVGELRPIRIPDAVMTNFVREVSDNAKPQLLSDILSFGDAVKITDGPFAGFPATIGKMLNKSVAEVFVDVMGGKRAARLPVESLEAA